MKSRTRTRKPQEPEGAIAASPALPAERPWAEAAPGALLPAASSRSLETQAEAEPEETGSQQPLLTPGGGRALDPSTRNSMESRFGYDFGSVRVHTDEAAASSARSLEARAYTHGSEIAFAPGQYAPATREGQWLLAHELAHVVQGGGTDPAPRRSVLPGVEVAPDDDAAEQRADRAADQAVTTGRVDQTSLTPGGSSGLRRKPAAKPTPHPAAVTPSGPSSYEPPGEVIGGMIPLDTQVVSIDTRPISQAIFQAEWPKQVKSDPAWPGWDEIAALTDPRYWSEALKAAGTGLGVRKVLSTTDLAKGWMGSYFFAQIVIQAKVVSWSFESADGTGIQQQSVGGPTLASGGSFSNTSTLTGGGQVGGGVGGHEGAPSGSGSVNASASQATAVGTSSGVTNVGTVGTQSSALEGVRFKVNLHFTVGIFQRLQAGTTTQILSLGGAGIGNMIAENPAQQKLAEGSAIVRFPKVRCTAIP